jgi:hypothetical protein
MAYANLEENRTVYDVLTSQNEIIELMTLNTIAGKMFSLKMTPYKGNFIRRIDCAHSRTLKMLS